MAYVAAPINKQSDQVTLVDVPVVHQTQLVSETLPKKVKKAAKPAPQQDYSQNVGCEAYRDEVAEYSGWDVNIMLAIAKAESGCRAGARGDGHLTYQKNGRTYGYSLGIFQVRILPGRERCDTFNAQVNVRCAHEIFKTQGYTAWTVYRKGLYKKYL